MKVLKIAAIVVGVVALAATGIGLAAGAGTLASAFGYGLGAIGLGSVVGAVGLGTLGAIALGAIAIDLSMIAGALAPKPSTGGNQTKWKADPYAGIPYVMGRTLVGGNIVLKRGHGANYKYLTAVTVLGLGPFASIDATFFDKTQVAFDGAGAATGSYAGQAWQRTQLGTCPEVNALSTPIGNPPGWTAAHRLSGLAAAIDSFLYDGKSENGLTSVPPPAWIVKGALVYDPRLDSTYPGGSGPCRAWNEATYVWSEDPHLHALTWSMGRYQNGFRVAGIGTGTPVPGGTVKGIDVASFVEGANLNDARGWKIGGQVYTRPDTPWNSLKAMLQAGGARPVLVGGVISCVNSAPKVSLATITRDDIVGATEFAGTQRRRQRINAIIPQYRSEQHDWEMVSAKRVSVPSFETLDGDERTREISWPLVQSATQVSQLAALAIYELREAGPGTVPLKPWWLNYRIGDCVTFSPEDGFALKCAITGRGLDAQTGAVSMTLRGETDGKHPYALGQTGVAPPIASLNYIETVDAPGAGEWTIAGTELSANGTTVPALIVTGACANDAAEAVIVEYRLHSAGQADGAGWLGASVEAPTLTRKEIASVTTATQYDVGVRYRVRGKLGPRLILGPAATSGFTAPGTQGPPGADGEDGLPGAPGANGQTSYVHFAYADSADGTVNFTTGVAGARTYIGVYSDFTAADSNDPGSYRWSLIKGADGANGTPGPAGANGQSTYVHIAYASSADGTVGFHLSDPTGRTYIGVYTDFILADSSDPAAYSWSLIKGADGVNGAPGISPVAASASPANKNFTANYDGSIKSGQIPFSVAISGTKAGAPIGGTTAIISVNGCTASVVSGGFQVDSVTGDTGFVEWEFTATDGQKARTKWSFSRVKDPSSGATSSRSFSAGGWIGVGTYPPTGEAIVLNASTTGKLNISGYAAFTAAVANGNVTLTAKLQYRLVGGSFTDAGFSGSDTAFNFAGGPGEPPEVSPGYIQIGGLLSGLTPGAAYEMQMVGSATGSAIASVNGTVSLGQVA